MELTARRRWTIGSTALTALLAGLFGTQPAEAAAPAVRHGGQVVQRTPDVGIDLNAPVLTREDIVIKAPLSRIWQIQTDIDNWPSWQPGVISATVQTPDCLRVGSVFHWLVEGLDVTSTVKQIRPLRRIVWGGPGNGITATHVWTFTPEPDGIHVHTEESWSGAPVDADVEYAQSALDASLDAWVHNLKKAAEQPATRKASGS
jgi:uncharacterized membrane protein